MKQDLSLHNLYLKIGLEVHAQINTNTKLFSRSPNLPCDTPNHHIKLFDIGIPGILPKLNSQAVYLAVKSGLALNCKINRTSRFDRKHYQYPDLPLGYQITQFFHPICSDGYIDIGKPIRINRIHMESDAGKTIRTSRGSLLDYNRVGVPLMEIVTEPDLSSAQEVESFLKELMLILEYIGSCECNMELGNLRVDVNLSLNGQDGQYGTRVELKNINSIKFIRDAISAECHRQQEAIIAGKYEGEVPQETRGYNSDTKTTYSMRIKETAAEYRYMPDANIPKLVLSEGYINQVQVGLLPSDKRRAYKALGLPETSYEILVNHKILGDMYDKLEPTVTHKQTFCNLVVGDLMGIIKHHQLELKDEFVNIAARIANLTDEITSKTAKLVLEEAVVNQQDPELIIKERNLYKISDPSEIKELLLPIIEANKPLWDKFLAGNDKLLMVFLGNLIKKTNGQVDASVTEKVILELKNIW